MHSPLTHVELYLMLALLLLGGALNAVVVPFARKHSRALGRAVFVASVLIAVSGGVFFWQWVMYGVAP